MHTNYNTIIRSVAICLLLSCNKGEPYKPLSHPAKEQVVISCNGKTMCYELNNIANGHNVKWKLIPGTSSIPSGYRLYYDDGDGRFYIRIDIYGLTPGAYGIGKEGPYKTGDASFLYSIAGKTLRARTGIVSISDINTATNTISGDFEVSAELNDTVYVFKDGLFVNVPM